VSAVTSDPDPSDNSATATTTVLTTADLSASMTDSPDPAHVGQNLTYTIRIANSGPSTATAVMLNDTLPKNAGYGSSSASQGTCTVKPSKLLVTCALGSIAKGGTATVTVVVKPTVKGTVSNTATVSSQAADPSSSNNSATVITTVVP
jgi:uncharacterized repeat protein (TIGR01451 family)